MQFDHERLKKYREKCGLNKEKAMEQLDIERRTLNLYESGRGLPGSLAIAKMAQLYGVSMRELLGDTEPGKLFPPGKLRFTWDPLREKRETEHKTWAQICEMCQYSPRSYNSFNLNHTFKKSPHIGTLIWVSEHLNIPIEDFFVAEDGAA